MNMKIKLATILTLICCAFFSCHDDPEPAPASNELTITVSNVAFKMVLVKGDTFQMGADTVYDKDFWDDEIPTHKVILSDYYIGKTEVTQALWKAVMGTIPSDNFKGGNKSDNYPVEKVSWNDCQKFISKLNSMTKKNFELPTEAQWEFAARGGRKSKFYKFSGGDGMKMVGWCDENSDEETHQTGTKKANELGIYDMSGNVREWCADWYDEYDDSTQVDPQGPDSPTNGDRFRVARGGSFSDRAEYCRNAMRQKSEPTTKKNYIGLRLVLGKDNPIDTKESSNKK